MNTKELIPVSFRQYEGGYIASVPMDQFFSWAGDPERTLKEAAQLYEQTLSEMVTVVAEIDALRAERRLLPARKVWRLGDLVFGLVEGLEQLSLQLDGLYDHLVRDLKVKRKWLEKVVILRRYLPHEEAIPESLNWGRVEKGTRRAAENLRWGMPPG